MSNQTQINKPSRGSSRSKAGSFEVPQSGEDKLWVSVPKDMYLHLPTSVDSPLDGCPTEWWWHIGTLKSLDGDRTFGFEINACAIYPGGFTEVMLTDVENQDHYCETKKGLPIPNLWAESDPSKPWFVALENVLMSAPQADPTQNMSVKAKLVEGDATVDFDLVLSQKGKPLYVFGDGMTPLLPGHTRPSLSLNNFYFSLTRLEARGTITITVNGIDEPEVIEVEGTTWMDHEWGNFSSKGTHNKGSKSDTGDTKNNDVVKWILQDMQFENGICLSNFALKMPVLNEPTAGMATVQLSAEDQSLYVASTMTPRKSFMKNGKEYFTEIDVHIPSLGIEATVTTLLNDQIFSGGIYEGIATASGKRVSSTPGSQIDTQLVGTGWIEQFIF